MKSEKEISLLPLEVHFFIFVMTFFKTLKQWNRLPFKEYLFHRFKRQFYLGYQKTTLFESLWHFKKSSDT